MDILKKYYKEDFKILVTLPEGYNNEPFEINVISGCKTYKAGYDGKSYTNCQVQNKQVLVSVGQHCLSCGLVEAEIIVKMADSSMPGGVYRYATRLPAICEQDGKQYALVLHQGKSETIETSQITISGLADLIKGDAYVIKDADYRAIAQIVLENYKERDIAVTALQSDEFRTKILRDKQYGVYNVTTSDGKAVGIMKVYTDSPSNAVYFELTTQYQLNESGLIDEGNITVGKIQTYERLLAVSGSCVDAGGNTVPKLQFGRWYNKEDVSDTAKKLSELESTTSEITKEVAKVTNKKVLVYKEGYIASDGSFIPDSNARSSDYIRVSGYTDIVYTTSISGGGFEIAYFDDNYNPLLDISIRGIDSDRTNHVSVPSNAKWVVLSSYRYNSANMVLSAVDSIENKFEMLRNNVSKRVFFDIGEANTIIKELYIESIDYSRIEYFQIAKAAEYRGTYNNIVRINTFEGKTVTLCSEEYSSEQEAVNNLRSIYGHSNNYILIDWENVSIGNNSIFATPNSCCTDINFSPSIKADLNGDIDSVDRLPNLQASPLAKINLYPGFAAIFDDWGFVGDSLSSGNHNIVLPDGTQTNADFPKYSWGQYMCRVTGAQGVNFSFGGATTKTWIERAWQECKSNPKKAYMIALGCNDSVSSDIPAGNINTDIGSYNSATDTDTNANTFAGYYAGIIQRLKSIQPKAKIFLVTLPKGDREYANRYNDVIRGMRNIFSNVFIVDLWEYATEVNGEWASRYRMAYHLNTLGYVYTAYEIMTYLDWIVRNNPSEFKDVALIGTSYSPG